MRPRQHTLRASKARAFERCTYSGSLIPESLEAAVTVAEAERQSACSFASIFHLRARLLACFLLPDHIHPRHTLLKAERTTPSEATITSRCSIGLMYSAWPHARLASPLSPSSPPASCPSCTRPALAGCRSTSRLSSRSLLCLYHSASLAAAAICSVTSIMLTLLQCFCHAELPGRTNRSTRLFPQPLSVTR